MTNTNTEMKFYKAAWGYDQTNIDFYVVVKETAKTVTLVEVEKDYKALDTQNTEVTPNIESAEKAIEAYNNDKKSVKAIRRTIKTCFATPTVKIDGSKYASLYQGNKAVETLR